MSVKKVPMRMCTACREMKPKKELIRIVKTPEGEILLDVTGKMNGRGAYICKNAECLAKAEKSGALARAFSSEVSKEIYEKLKQELTNAQ